MQVGVETSRYGRAAAWGWARRGSIGTAAERHSGSL